ncbi:MAG: CDF family Co(II)/Ni(II) efflux transporter DmeF [Campylobacterales bacterium]|nr:CDF family Co(II)/Ni(II) efflux transporter DmeF [Campylobacterales bacterium]
MDAKAPIHSHRFDEGNPAAERRVRLAVWLTLATMIVEIVAGWYYGSMALLADGWHMGTHALALGLSALAYLLSRRYTDDPRFAFGTWKIEVLSSYTSALLLGVVALGMFYHSALRLIEPVAIRFDEAMVVAVIGLAVNLVCAWLLHDHHHHDHDDHHHTHDHHHDLNLRSAYLHVLADAATSLLAIIALAAGKIWGAVWLDPLMGIVGGLLISIWALGLLRQSATVLLDAHMNDPVTQEIRDTLAQCAPNALITDLHVWRVGKGKYAVIVALQSPGALKAQTIRDALGIHEELVHITVEINQP